MLTGFLWENDEIGCSCYGYLFRINGKLCSTDKNREGTIILTQTETKQHMRIEKDFLGFKEVPAEAYHGVQTLRAVE